VDHSDQGRHADHDNIDGSNNGKIVKWGSGGCRAGDELVYLAAAAATATVACATAAMHRRHLMVWALFAPKFVFASVQLVVVLAVVAAGSLLADQRRPSFQESHDRSPDRSPD
jgi:hypothetical protein